MRAAHWRGSLGGETQEDVQNQALRQARAATASARRRRPADRGGRPRRRSTRRATPPSRARCVHRLRLDKRRRSLELHADDLRRHAAPWSKWRAGASRGRLVQHPERETLEVAARRAAPARRGHAPRSPSAASSAATCAASTPRASGERRYAFTQLEARRRAALLPVLRRAGLEGALPRSRSRPRRATPCSRTPRSRTTSRSAAAGRPCTSRATPPLSTYLLALAVGELEASEPRALRRRPRSASGTCRARSTLTRASGSRRRARRSRGSRTTSASPTPTRSSTWSPCPTSRPARWRTPAPSSSARRCCSSIPRPRRCRRRSAPPR